LRLLESRAKFGRGGAAYALANIGAREAIPAIARAVNDETDANLRLASAWALVHFDPQNDDYAALAVPRAIKALTHEWSLVRRESAAMLGLIGPRAESAIPALVKAINDPDPEVQAEVLHALAQMGPKAQPAIEPAVKLLDGDDPEVIAPAVYMLGKIGPPAKVAVPLLRRLLKSREERERTLGAWAIVNIAPNPEIVGIAIPLLAKVLTSHENPEARFEAATMLGKIGRGRPIAIAALRSSARTEKDPKVRKTAQEALKRIAPLRRP